MSTTPTSSGTSLIQWLIESRPPSSPAATWPYSHGQAILLGCWRRIGCTPRCEGSAGPPGDIPRRR